MEESPSSCCIASVSTGEPAQSSYAVAHGRVSQEPEAEELLTFSTFCLHFLSVTLLISALGERKAFSTPGV